MALASLSDIKRLSYSSSQSSMQSCHSFLIYPYTWVYCQDFRHTCILKCYQSHTPLHGAMVKIFYIYWNVIIFKLKFSWYITNIYLLVKTHNTTVKFLINRVRKDAIFFYRLILYMREQIWTLLHWLPI